MTDLGIDDEPTEKKLEKKVDHTAAQEYRRLHRCESGLDGGKCLGGHYGSYTPNRSCSYRWQAVHRAEQDLDVYWDEVKDEVEKGYIPFTTGALPWPNEAHHLIPKAELANVICTIAAGANGNVDLRIIQHLLTNSYNVNHHCNMMVLPQQAERASRLGLPTHPSYKYLSKGEPNRKQIRTHQDYSAEVNKKLQRILDPYKTWPTTGVCENPPEGPNIVKKLNDFSNQLHDRILDARVQFLAQHGGGSAASMSVNSNFFCNLVANIPV
jgi:hypothetical protein